MFYKKRNNYIVAVIALIMMCCTAYAKDLELPQNLIAYNSAKGVELFNSSNVKQDYWKLSQYFVTQKNLSYCGIASTVMVLNSLGVQPPIDGKYAPYSLFTQNNIFTQKVLEKFKPNDIIFHGMTLAQVGRLFKLYGLNVSVIYPTSINFKQFNALIVNALKQPNEYVVVNFCREQIKEKGCGHFSPLAAYNKSTDRFLLMDVSRYKYPPVWVKARDLWLAVNTRDNASHKDRGILIVKK